MISPEQAFYDRSEVWSRKKNNVLVITASGKKKGSLLPWKTDYD
jgi:hypothetical protein